MVITNSSFERNHFILYSNNLYHFKNAIFGGFHNYISFYSIQLMSLSRLKERLTQFKSHQNLRLVQHQYQYRRAHQISHPTNLLTRPKRQIESRLATQINDKVTLTKEELKRYAKILKMNPKPPINQNKSKTNNIHKPQYLNTIFTKRFDKEKFLSPNISKTAIKKQYNQMIPPLHKMMEKQKKGLKKAKQSKNNLKTEHNQSLIMHQKSKKAKSRQAISRKQSKKQLRKRQNQVSLQSTPSCIFTEEVDMMGQIGEGTFGIVYKGKLKRNGEIVAIKKVLQDSRYKNREIQIIKYVKNDFICEIIGSYLTQESNHEYLNIIMKCYQQNLFERIKSYPVGRMPNLQTKILLYQLFKGLSYLHSKNICHRDIKPQNILLHGNSAVICDFGSAKIMLKQESNISYICARCYRAPQLIFGSTRYTTQVDIWSAGCIILQILNGDPLFIGETSISHLLDIIKILGTPTKQQVFAMNPKYEIRSFKFPKYQKKSWKQIFPDADHLLLNLLSHVMVYSPHERATAIKVLSLEYFDELRDELTYSHISSMYHLNDFFNFSKDQLAHYEHLTPTLIPKWYEQ